MWGDNWDIVACLAAGDGAELPRVPGAWGTDGWAVGDVAAPCPAMPGGTGVMNWPGLSAGGTWQLVRGRCRGSQGRKGSVAICSPAPSSFFLGKLEPDSAAQPWDAAAPSHGRCEGMAHPVASRHPGRSSGGSRVRREGEAWVQCCCTSAKPSTLWYTGVPLAWKMLLAIPVPAGTCGNSTAWSGLKFSKVGSF